VIRDYTAWVKGNQPTPEQIAAEQEADRQRAIAGTLVQQSILRYEQTFQGRHDGAELVERISTREVSRRCA
jgi:hypothetical protein